MITEIHLVSSKQFWGCMADPRFIRTGVLEGYINTSFIITCQSPEEVMSWDEMTEDIIAWLSTGLPRNPIYLFGKGKIPDRAITRIEEFYSNQREKKDE